MLLLPAAELPDDDKWLIELKLDGFRAIAFKADGKVHLRSRNDKDFNSRYPVLVRALGGMPDETVIDGEVVALDQDGRPSFSALQNFGSAGATLVYYVFDLMVLRGRDGMAEPLDARRALLEAQVLPTLIEPVRYSPELRARMTDLIQSVKVQRLEGLIAKRRDSQYEPGKRSGAWLKMRINRGQGFVIGGYTVGGATFDALIFGYYDGDDLIYAARTRNGFTPKSRAELKKTFQSLETEKCPFANLPEQHAGRWGVGLTAAKMADCHWLEPRLVGQFEYVEWTPEGHLRHSRFVRLQCGIDLIEEKGIGALTLREIGKRLGVSRTAAYAHFKDKAALLAAIRDAGFIEFGKILESAKAGATGFAAQMDAMGIAYFRFANEHFAQFEVMFNALLEAGGGAAAESGRGFAILTETVREAQHQGEVRPGDPALLARVVWALVHGASMLQRAGEPQFISFSNEVLRSGLNDRHSRGDQPRFGRSTDMNNRPARRTHEGTYERKEHGPQ